MQLRKRRKQKVFAPKLNFRLQQKFATIRREIEEKGAQFSLVGNTIRSLVFSKREEEDNNNTRIGLLL